DEHVHAERLAVARHELADLSVAPDAERLAAEHLSEAEVRRQRRRLQSRLLPRALLQVRDVLRNAPLRRHDERPRQLGRGHRRAGPFQYRDAAFRACIDIYMAAARAPALADRAHFRE